MANYYMKFNQDFFDSSEIKLLESLDNGESLVFLYLKLATRAIQFDGYLILNENVSFDIKMIALIFKKEISFIEEAINYYKMFGLIIENDGILYMEHIARFIGKKDNSKERVAKYRARKKQEKECNALQDVTKVTSNALQDVTVTDSNKKCNDILRDRVIVKEDIELNKEMNSRFNDKFKAVAETKSKQKEDLNSKRNKIKESIIEICNYYYSHIRPNKVNYNTKKDLALILERHTKENIINCIKNYSEKYKGDKEFILGVNKFFNDDFFTVYLDSNVNLIEVEKEILELKSQPWLFYNSDTNGKMNEVGESQVDEIYAKYNVKREDIIEAEFKVVEG